MRWTDEEVNSEVNMSDEFDKKAYIKSIMQAIRDGILRLEE